MSEMITKITDALGPALSGALGQALIGLGILFLGMFIVKIIVRIFITLLNKVNFLKEKQLTDPISSLIKAVLTIFVLMAVLQHFGLTDVLEPLKTMMNDFFTAVPRMIGAGVVIYAGWVIATIVSQLVAIALGKVDEQLAERTGNTDIKISKFGSAFIFGGVLLPIVVTGLGILDIPVISDPASNMINELITAVPNIVGAGIILLVTWFVVKFVIYMLTGLLEGMHVNSLPEKLGLQGVFNESFTPIRLISGAIMFFSMLTAATGAINTLGISIISDIFSKVLEFGGGILVGTIILIIGNFLGTLAYKKLNKNGSSAMASIARIAILGLVLAMGLRSMGLADNIVNMAFGFSIGAVAIAAALAFGLGGRDAAKTVADSWASKITK